MSRLQRIGLSATQRPLEEVARFLGGAEEREKPVKGQRAQGKGERAKGNAAAPKGTRPRGKTADRRSKAEEMPLEEVEAELHDQFAGEEKPATFRPVTIVNASEKKQLKLRIEVPIEDMARVAAPIELPSGPASQGAARPSIWASIHPRLLDLIRAHQSTLLFVNSRRLAERMAGALNKLAGEPPVPWHHGFLPPAPRLPPRRLSRTGRC